MVWGVLARMLAEPPAEPGLPGRQAALLRGARRHLEAGHAAHMHATVQANRHLARPAGPEACVYGGLCPEWLLCGLGESCCAPAAQRAAPLLPGGGTMRPEGACMPACRPAAMCCALSAGACACHPRQGSNGF